MILEAAVARFYFNQQTPAGLLIDPDGSELPDLETARAEAIAGARQLWAAAIVAGIDIPVQSFEIADEDGRHLLSVPFSEALPRSLRP